MKMGPRKITSWTLRSWRRKAALAFMLLLAPACSEEEKTSAREGIEPIIDAQCAWLFACCSDGELDYSLGPFTEDAPNCVERILAALESGNMGLPTALTGVASLLYLAYDIDLDRVELDMDGIQACADSITEEECNAPPEWGEEPPEHCIPGEVPEEDPCEVDKLLIGLQGVGEECNPAMDFECEGELRCVDHDYVGICARAAAIGEFCFDDTECEAELYCDFESGTCERGADVGEPCAYSDPANPIPGTESTRCAAGLSCNPTTGRCVEFCAEGAICVGDIECPEGLLCVLGRCRRPGLPGDPCGRDEDCISEACDMASGICQSRLPTGALCNQDIDCDSRFCNPFTGYCERGSMVGEPCLTMSDVECIGGWCDPLTDPDNPICRDYVGAGELCPQPQACDAEADLTCISGVCFSLPLANGTQCTMSMECESLLCWEGLCQNGTAVGGGCDTVGLLKPCDITAYCMVGMGATQGTCLLKHQAGEECLMDEQCWGSCVARWGGMMCDTTPAYSPPSAVCDEA
jgi:hypothetical protein